MFFHRDFSPADFLFWILNSAFVFPASGFGGDGRAWRAEIQGAGLVERWWAVYLAAMNVNAIVGGKLIKLKLSPGLAAAWKQNKGRHMSETEAVRFVETKRREHALRQASPYLATRA
jgi:hypothetical protein